MGGDATTSVVGSLAKHRPSTRVAHGDIAPRRVRSGWVLAFGGGVMRDKRDEAEERSDGREEWWC